jgi:CRP/FNR family transcriptional regulator, cyclic AMP receptor protein
MSAIELSALLQTTKLFGTLSTDLRREIASAMREEHFNAGQTVFARDEPGTALYLIAEGRVRLSVLNMDGRELTFRFVGPGEIMGEIAALDAGPRTADAVAMTAVRAHVLSQSRLAQLMAAHGNMSRAAVSFLCARLRDTSAQVEEIALHPIERRVARFLVTALRMTRPGFDGQTNVPLDLKLTQAELGLLLGASRPKVNGAFGTLESDGALSRKGDKLICHPDVLLRFAGFDEA